MSENEYVLTVQAESQCVIKTSLWSLDHAVKLTSMSCQSSHKLNHCHDERTNEFTAQLQDSMDVERAKSEGSRSLRKFRTTTSGEAGRGRGRVREGLGVFAFMCRFDVSALPHDPLVICTPL